MALIGLTVVAVALGGQILLVSSVVRRLRVGESLATALRAHGVVPRWAQSRPVAVMVEAAQAALGLAGVALIASGSADGGTFTLVYAATAVLFAGFAVYLAAVARRRGRVRCSCLAARERADAASVTRAGAFAVAAALAAALGLPAGTLTWPARVALAGGGIMVAGFAVFLVALGAMLRVGREQSS